MITGFSVDSKSIVTKVPTDDAIWSSNPQGLPKNTFSAYCAIFAISTALIAPSLKSYETVVPKRTSNAADEESPLPPITSEVVTASKPPIS